MKEKKLPIFFFSLLFAFLVWVSVNLGNNFQTLVEVPVRIENLHPSQALAVPLPETVRLKIQGRGWQLLNAVLNPNLRYTIDFSKLSRKDTIFTYKNLNERISLSNDIHIFETSPETVMVLLDVKTTKKVPLIPTVMISFRNGFGIVGGMKTHPDSITITGARAMLNKIHRWKTRPITLNDMNAPAKITVEILDSLSLEVSRSHSSATIEFDVQPIAEKTINDIPIEINQIPENRNVVLLPPTVSIIIRSGVNAIAPLTEKDFYAFIDYKSILLDTSGMVQLIILGPDDIKIVQQNPEKIRYVVRK